jgi:hypothetical protein
MCLMPAWGEREIGLWCVAVVVVGRAPPHHRRRAPPSLAPNIAHILPKLSALFPPPNLTTLRSPALCATGNKLVTIDGRLGAPPLIL